ncbi:hypothetical protein [Hymenobacter ruber]
MDQEAARHGEIIVVTIPPKNIHDLPKDPFANVPADVPAILRGRYARQQAARVTSLGTERTAEQHADYLANHAKQQAGTRNDEPVPTVIVGRITHTANAAYRRRHRTPKSRGQCCGFLAYDAELTKPLPFSACAGAHHVFSTYFIEIDLLSVLP